MKLADLNLSSPEMFAIARDVADKGAISRTAYLPGLGETWAAHAGSFYVVIDSLSFEVRLSTVRDTRQTGLEGRKFSTELPRTWSVLDGPFARDIRARVLLRSAAAGIFTAPGCGWDLERFRSELLEPVVLEVA